VADLPSAVWWPAADRVKATKDKEVLTRVFANMNAAYKRLEARAGA
jgi:hypothetical protein